MTPTQKEEHCGLCDGKGIKYEQPYGLAVKCWMCEGTGQEMTLSQLQQVRSLQGEINRISGKSGFPTA